jgi:hypothetical protein
MFNTQNKLSSLNPFDANRIASTQIEFFPSVVGALGLGGGWLLGFIRSKNKHTTQQYIISFICFINTKKNPLCTSHEINLNKTQKSMFDVVVVEQLFNYSFSWWADNRFFFVFIIFTPPVCADCYTQCSNVRAHGL